jgi:hydroxymethylpyrimidine pyrophosphatase-like HAD family hydrolase
MHLLVEKLKQQEKISQNTLLLFLDIDATISTYSLSGFSANKKTAYMLRKKFIPYILITGRPHWHRLNALEMKLYGLYLPDAVITGNGTSLLWRNPEGTMEKDTQWDSLIRKNWNEQKIQDICSDFHFSFPVIKKNFYKDKPLFLCSVRNAPIDALFAEIAKLKTLLPKQVRIDISESLFFKNT